MTFDANCKNNLHKMSKSIIVEKIRKIIVSLSSAEIAQRVEKVKENDLISLMNRKTFCVCEKKSFFITCLSTIAVLLS